MALIKCPVCGREVSEAAKACPSCGHPIRGSDEPKVVVEKKSGGCFSSTLNFGCGFVMWTGLLLLVMMAPLEMSPLAQSTILFGVPVLWYLLKRSRSR